MDNKELESKLNKRGHITTLIVIISFLFLLLALYLIFWFIKKIAVLLLIPAILVFAFSVCYRRAISKQKKIVREQRRIEETTAEG